MKSYGQYCALAKALDHIGDRWTLLIVRELLIEPRRYSQIREALPGVATNLLADRLRNLEADGLIDKGSNGSYRLTSFGRGLEGAIHELVRWGGRWMEDGRGSDHFRPQWLAVALEALLPLAGAGDIEIRVDDSVVHVTNGRVSEGPLEEPDAVIEGSAEEILGVAAGVLPLSVLSLRGDRCAVERLIPKAQERAEGSVARPRDRISSS